MANTFKRFTQREIGNTLTQIDSYAVGSGAVATVIGLTCSNTSGDAVDVDVTLNDGTNDFYIVKNCPLPSGSTVILIGGDQKVVLDEKDLVQVKSNTATSADVVMSMLDIT